MKTVYLAGPISGLDYNGCNEWREYAKSTLKRARKTTIIKSWQANSLSAILL